MKSNKISDRRYDLSPLSKGLAFESANIKNLVQSDRLKYNFFDR